MVPGEPDDAPAGQPCLKVFLQIGDEPRRPVVPALNPDAALDFDQGPAGEMGEIGAPAPDWIEPVFPFEGWPAYGLPEEFEAPFQAGGGLFVAESHAQGVASTTRKSREASRKKPPGWSSPNSGSASLVRRPTFLPFDVGRKPPVRAHVSLHLGQIVANGYAQLHVGQPGFPQVDQMPDADLQVLGELRLGDPRGGRRSGFGWPIC